MRKNRPPAPSPVEGMTGADASRISKGAKGKRPPAEKVEPPLTPDDIDLLVVHIILCPSVREQAVALLKPMFDSGTAFELFANEGEVGVAETIGVILSLSENYPAYIPYGTVRSKAMTALNANPAVDDEAFEDIVAIPEGDDPKVGLLHHAYKQVNKSDLDPPYAVELLKRLLRERMVKTAVADFESKSLRGVPASTSTLMNALSRVEELVNSASVSPFSSIEFTGDMDELPTFDYIPTGMPFFDEPLGGGLLDHDITGLIGMVHAGKSTITAQLAQSVALFFGRRYAQERDYGHRRVMVFSYEDNELKFKNRVWSCAARISRDSLKARDLSTTGNLKPYEVAQAKREGIDLRQFPGERERLLSITAKLKDHVDFIDMKKDGRGRGGVAEVSAIMKQSLRARDGRPGLIIIDYANVMVKRQIQDRGGRPQDELRHAVAALADQFGSMIVGPHGIPVWIMQQFATRETGKRWDAPLHASNASECSSFFENLDNCFLLGNRDKQTSVAYIQCDKAKQTDGMTHERALVRLDGEFATFSSAKDRYTVIGGRPVEASEANMVQGPVNAPRQRRTAAATFDSPFLPGGA